MKQFLRALVICFAPYFVFVAYLIWRGPQFISGMASWVWWVALGYFLVALVVVGAISRRGRTTAPATQKAGDSHSTSRTLKGALILYILIFLNGLGLALSGMIPLTFAVPGLTIDVLLIALFLWLLGRQKKDGEEEVGSPNARG